MQMLLLILAAFLPWSSAAQSLRTDLEDILPTLFCQNFKKIPTMQELWQKNIFETQLDAAWIRSADGREPLLIQDIETMARDQAKAKRHLGYAYGLCSTHEAWILTSPAAAPPSQWTPAGLKFDIKSTRDRCERVALHYASALKGRPKDMIKIKSMAEDSLLVHPALLEPGTISLTCYPADKKNQGPELWSLVPIHKVKTTDIPHFSTQHHEGTSGLIAWIQAIREAEGLKVLQTEIPLLRKFANQLLAETSIRHPHAKLMAQKRLLAKKKINILGENRVKATTNEQMAWLLWYSPTHRQLLLHKSATALGFDVARLQNEKLLVLVLAKI